MVQRKVIINKLIITESNKPVLNLKSSSSSSIHQHHDHRVKNNNLATELKKKLMKKSGSTKRQELESVCSANFRKLVKGKVYPADETPEKPQQLKVSLMDMTVPNYMKSTTSSIAKKDQSSLAQVSTKTPQTSSGCSVPPRKCSSDRKLVLASGKKEMKIQIRTNSLRTVRTMAKNSNFKSRINIVKKRSKVVLCEDMIDVRKATCSSTLKDFKFPAYLELSPGGTESEGTSMFKVCPYTYCSLNGHLHKPLLPLKLFLSAKRRAIKVQKSLKLVCLSPRQLNPNGDGSNEEKILMQDDIMKSPRVGILSEEKNMDYFIEVYSKLSGADDREEQALERVSNEIVCSDVDAQEAFSPTEDADSANICSIDEDVSSKTLVQEEKEVAFVKGLDSDASDMESDMSLASAIYDDVKYEYSPQMEIEAETKESEDEVHDKFTINSDKEESDDCFNEFLEDNISQDSTYVDSDAYSISYHSETNEAHNVEIDVSENKNVESQLDSYEKVSKKTENFMTLSHLNPEKEPKPEIEMVIGSNLETEDTDFTQFTAKLGKSITDLDEMGSFNPRGPNFLPLEPDPDAEKIDLRHQEVDERKNAEEWMVDYALRQAVTRLAPARKRKVALLVEAFEKVMPVSKCEIHMRQSLGFDLARPVQACN